MSSSPNKKNLVSFNGDGFIPPIDRDNKNNECICLHKFEDYGK